MPVTPQDLQVALSFVTSGGWVLLLLAFVCFVHGRLVRGAYDRALAAAEDVGRQAATPAAAIQAPGEHLVEGRVECAEPLTVPVCGEPAVFFTYHLTEHWSETRTTTTIRHRKRHTHTTQVPMQRMVEDKDGAVPFMVRDASGAIAVDPRGADRRGAVLLAAYRAAGGAPPGLGEALLGSMAQAFVPGTRSGSTYMDHAVGLRVGAEVHVRGLVVREPDGTLRFRQHPASPRPLAVVAGTRQAAAAAMAAEARRTGSTGLASTFACLAFLAVAGILVADEVESARRRAPRPSGELELAEPAPPRGAAPAPARRPLRQHPTVAEFEQALRAALGGGGTRAQRLKEPGARVLPEVGSRFLYRTAGGDLVQGDRFAEGDEVVLLGFGVLGPSTRFPGFHELYEARDGLFIGRSGAASYVMDAGGKLLAPPAHALIRQGSRIYARCGGSVQTVMELGSMTVAQLLEMGDYSLTTDRAWVERPAHGAPKFYFRR